MRQEWAIGVLSSLQLRHRGPSSVTSYHCTGKRWGEGFLLSWPDVTRCERKRNPGEVSLSFSINVLLEKAACLKK